MADPTTRPIPSRASQASTGLSSATTVTSARAPRAALSRWRRVRPGASASSRTTSRVCPASAQRCTVATSRSACSSRSRAPAQAADRPSTRVVGCGTGSGPGHGGGRPAEGGERHVAGGDVALGEQQRVQAGHEVDGEHLAHPLGEPALQGARGRPVRGRADRQQRHRRLAEEARQGTAGRQGAAADDQLDVVAQRGGHRRGVVVGADEDAVGGRSEQTGLGGGGGEQGLGHGRRDEQLGGHAANLGAGDGTRWPPQVRAANAR